MKQLTRNVAAESELLFGDDLNKRISQINNANNALAKLTFTRASQNGRYNKNQVLCNTTSNNYQQSKNGYPHGGTLLQGEGETTKATTGTTETKLNKFCGKNAKNFRD